MREIKFKVYDADLEQMYHLLENRYSFGTSEENRAVSWEDVFAERYDCLIPLQYTGLKDKNGKEIYEGDILYYEDGEFSFTAKVVYNDWGFYLKGIAPNDNYSFQEITGNCVVDAEIIGNIYQHPHLLEGATNGSS